MRLKLGYVEVSTNLASRALLEIHIIYHTPVYVYPIAIRGGGVGWVGGNYIDCRLDCMC